MENSYKKYNMGEKLPNGAIVIDGEAGKVLAMYRNEYVTWATNEEGHTFWGHYYKTLREALDDYERRGSNAY